MEARCIYGRPHPFLLDKYLKTTWTVFPPPRMFGSCSQPSVWVRKVANYLWLDLELAAVQGKLDLPPARCNMKSTLNICKNFKPIVLPISTISMFDSQSILSIEVPCCTCALKISLNSNAQNFPFLIVCKNLQFLLPISKFLQTVENGQFWAFEFKDILRAHVQQGASIFKIDWESNMEMVDIGKTLSLNFLLPISTIYICLIAIQFCKHNGAYRISLKPAYQTY